MRPQASGRSRALTLSRALPLILALGLSSICFLEACSGPKTPTTALHGDDIRGVMPSLEFTLTGPSGATMTAAPSARACCWWRPSKTRISSTSTVLLTLRR